MTSKVFEKHMVLQIKLQNCSEEVSPKIRYVRFWKVIKVYLFKLGGSLHVRVNPVNKVAGLGVHSRVAGLGASISPADNSVKTKSTHEGATRVSLQ